MTFADTGYWIALLSPCDTLHGQSARLSQGLSGSQLVTTDLVLGEVLTFFSAMGPGSRAAAAALVRDCLTDPKVLAIEVDRALFTQALTFYEGRSNKGYSLADCASFTVMRQLGIQDWLTADRHFAREGFRALMIE